MPRRKSYYRDQLLEDLSDPVEAKHYLNAAWEDSPKMFLRALRDVAKSRQRISEVAKQAVLSREHIYRSFSESGNPTIETLLSVMDVLGYCFPGVELADESLEPSASTPIAAKLVHRKAKRRGISTKVRVHAGEIGQLVLQFSDDAAFARTVNLSIEPSNLVQLGQVVKTVKPKNPFHSSLATENVPADLLAQTLPPAFMIQMLGNQTQLGEILR